jgi:hypothetical protein
MLILGLIRYRYKGHLVLQNICRYRVKTSNVCQILPTYLPMSVATYCQHIYPCQLPPMLFGNLKASQCIQKCSEKENIFIRCVLYLNLASIFNPLLSIFPKKVKIIVPKFSTHKYIYTYT